MSQRIQLHKLVQQAERLGRRHPIRSQHAQLASIYDSINRAVFSGTLQRPRIRLSSSREFWGEIEVGYRGHRHGPRHTLCMRFARQFPSMKTMINTVAHEMVHQWEWERNNNLTHGQAFYAWNERLANRGLRL
jgi:DNA topoisomerase VI subunit B